MNIYKTSESTDEKLLIFKLENQLKIKNEEILR